MSYSNSNRPVVQNFFRSNFYCALLLITNEIPNISNILFLIKVKRKDTSKFGHCIESKKPKSKAWKMWNFSISLTSMEKAQRIFNRIHCPRPQIQAQIWKVNWIWNVFFFLYAPATSRQSQAKNEQIPSFDCCCFSSKENKNNKIIDLSDHLKTIVVIYPIHPMSECAIE